MLETSNQLKKSFDKLIFKNPIIPIVLNYSARPFEDLGDLKNSLVKQTFSTVRWYESVSFMIKEEQVYFWRLEMAIHYQI